MFIVASLAVRWIKEDQSNQGSVVLPGNVKLSLAGVTYGTNHMIGSPLAKWVARRPIPVQTFVQKIFGQYAVLKGSTLTSQPKLVVWLSPPSFTGGRHMLQAYLSQTNGDIGGDRQSFILAPYGGTMPLQFSAFPRRERTLEIVFYENNAEGRQEICGRLKIRNPACQQYPNWKAETLPVTRRVGDVEMTFEKFQARLGYGIWVGPGSKRQGGMIEYILKDAGGIGPSNNFSGIFRLESKSNTNEFWTVSDMELLDATGNQLRPESFYYTWLDSLSKDAIFTFNLRPGLWPDEGAWKLRCEIKRNRGFSPDELVTFKGVPVGMINETNAIYGSTNLHGVNIRLDKFVFRPSLPTKTKSNGISTMCYAGQPDSTEVWLDVDGLPNDFYVDVFEARQDDGNLVEGGRANGSGRSMRFDYSNISPETKTLDLTFAVHQAHWVEFTVKPEVGSNTMVYTPPAETKN